MLKNKKEKTMLASSWIITTLLLIIFVPKNKIREAHVSFLFKQVVTWIFGLLVVDNKLISYPVRLFKGVNKASFTFEYYVYPVLCALFNIHFPEKRNAFVKLLYYTFHTMIISGFELYAIKYTKLIKYHRWWSFKTSFASMFFTYYISRLYYRWFFKPIVIYQKNENSTPN